MVAITEDYVSFETAKLLKDKGFDTAVCHYYQKIDDDITYHIEDFRNWNVYDMWYSMPTLQMTIKWLNEAHNILLVILPAHENGKRVYRVEVWTWNEEEGIFESTYAPMSRKKPEQAVEAAIRYCLENLI